MKKQIVQIVKSRPVLMSVAALALLLVIVGIACTPSSDINVVTDVEPVRAATPAQQQILDSLQGLSMAKQNEILQREWPDLTTNLIGWLRQDGRIKTKEKIEKIELFYGDAHASSEDVDGTIHTGHFNDELLASIVIVDRKDPMLIAVRCTNGLYDVVKGDLHPLGERSLVFTIEKGQSLVDYVSFETAIHLAETFDLSIHRDRGSKRHVIDGETALETDTNLQQVRVLVYEGDRFDLGAMTYKRQ